jgi:WD40 repeat protein
MCRAPIAAFLVLVSVLAASTAAGQPATDATGDPLPKGALFRIGTIRWRTGTIGWRDASTLSAAGRSVFVGGERGDIRVFDRESGRLARTLRGHDGQVNALAVSPDGKRLASAGYEQAFLWDLDTGKPLRPLKVRSVSAMTFTPDGKKLITGGDDHEHSIRVLDVASGKETLRLLWHQRRVTFVGCGPDNKTLVSASWDNHIRVTDLTTGEAIHTFKSGNANDPVVAFASDGKTIAVADMRYQKKEPRWQYAIRLIDAATGAERTILDQGKQRMSALAFAPDSQSLLAVGDGDAQVYDVACGKVLRTLPGVRGWRFTPDGRHAVSIGALIRVWDFASGKELHPPEGPVSAADSIAFAPDGKTLASSGFSDDTAIHLWDATSGKFKATLAGHDKKSYVRAVQFAPDGRLISGGGDSTIRVWDVDAAKEVLQLKLHDSGKEDDRLQVVTMQVAADGRTLAAAAVGFGGPFKKEGTRVFAWDLAKGKRIAQLSHQGSSVDWPGFSADARTFLAHDEKGVVLKELAGGKELLRLQPVPQPSGKGVLNPNTLEAPFTFSPDGKTVAVCGSRQRNDGQRYWRDQYAIVLFDLSTGREVHRIAVNEWLARAAFSPDGKRLAAADGPGVRIWDTASGKRLWEVPELDARVTALAFSPDGRRLATALANVTVLVWDVGGLP